MPKVAVGASRRLEPDRGGRLLGLSSSRFHEIGYVDWGLPAIAKGFKTPWFYAPLDLWKYWEAIKVPMLVLHGAKSDLLSIDLTSEMRRRNRRADLFRFDDRGHARPLMTTDHIVVVTDLLEAAPRNLSGDVS